MRKLFLSVALMAMICSSAMAATASEGLRSNVQKDYLNSVKITFLSWLSGSTKVSYERAFPQMKQSGELCASLISAGYDKYDNDSLGFTVRYGHKFFMFDHDDVALKGFYLRPELERTLANIGTLLGTIGYQHGFELWHWFGSENKNLAMSFSIRLGFCF